jgi:hypothetical protein
MKTNRLLLFLVFLSLVTVGKAQVDSNKVFEIYGFIMMDAGYNFNQIHADWYDVVRPTKLPSYKNEFGTDGNFFFSVRQTRLGFKNYFKTPMGTLKTHFEFEMFGTGVDAGQTTIRLRHAYAELGKFGVGQYWSPFMDIDVFPNTVEYWGPNGMVFFRNVQVRYMPIQGENRLTIALERPGASADGGIYADRVELESVRARFPVPDLSFEFRKGLKIGYVELAGIARWMEWKDLDEIGEDYSGEALGWGINLSTNLNFTKNDVFRGQVVYGAGIENYMNDAPVDVAIDGNNGVAVPLLGVVAFLDHTWSKKFSSSLGWSMLDIMNTDGQSDDAFSLGHYAVGNLMYYPVENAMMGVELQYGTRENYKDDWNTDIFKVQFSFKYNFSHAFYK